MKNKNIYLLIFTILLYGSTCNRQGEDCHKYITFINNSDSAIYTIPGTNYPDTLRFGNGGTTPSLNEKILPNDSGHAAGLTFDCLEHIFYPERIASDTLMIYVFDAEIIETEDWGQIMHDYLVLKRYDLSLQDLKDMNWTITYP